MQTDSIDEIKKYLNELQEYEESWLSTLYFTIGNNEEDNAISERIPFPLYLDKPKESLCIYTDCISMALILGEYSTVMRLAGSIPDINLVLTNTHIDTADNSYSFIIPFEELLYSDKTDIPENLRLFLLKKCHEGWVYGPLNGVVDVDHIQEIFMPEIQSKIINDYLKHPEFFDYHDSPGKIEEITAACFLMKLYRNEPEKLSLLMNGRIIPSEYTYSWRNAECAKVDIKSLKEAWEYEWLQEYKPILFSMTIGVYTEIKRACDEDSLYYNPGDTEHNNEPEEAKSILSDLAQFIDNISISEEEYLKSMERIRSLGITATINSLSFGETLLGHKPTYVISSLNGQSIESFFDISPEEDEDDIYYGIITIRKIKQYTVLAEKIGKIEYRVWKPEDIGAEIVWFLSHNAKYLKDSFKLFAEKRLIPPEHLDHVINGIKKHSNCQYMLSFLNPS